MPAPAEIVVTLIEMTRAYPLPAANPAQAVLETTLRGYSCLTVGDAICVHYNNKKYFIDVIEARPANAIGVIDTDCQVLIYPWPQASGCGILGLRPRAPHSIGSSGLGHSHCDD